MIALPSLAETSRLIAAGKLTASELVELALAQIERWEPRVQAWVHLDASGARAEAARLDGLARAGSLAGPLHGVPLGIKDIIDVALWPTLAGSPLRAGHVATTDAACVRRLRAAGAILLGKTVTTQFASFDPSPTRNPWNLEHSPGGSSSGSAAAVAAGMCAAALGTQTGGSITRPAAYCGVCGLKPTFGALSLAGVIPLAWQLDHLGILARRVADLQAVWHTLADPEGTSNLQASVAESPDPLRVGIPAEFFEQPEFIAANVLACVQAALRELHARGALLVPVRLSSLPLEAVLTHHRRIMAVEAATYHRQNFAAHREAYAPNLAQLIAEGHATLALDYAASLEARRNLRLEVATCFTQCHVLATPATTSVAPGLATTGNPACNSPWSLLGWPTVNFPCGMAAGLPVGLQLIGPAGGERELLAAAAWCEQAFPFASPAPPVLGRVSSSQ